MPSNYFGGKYKKFGKPPDRKRLPSVAIVREYLSEVKLADRKTTLSQSNKSARQKKNTTFCYTIQTIPPGFTYTEENTMGK